MTSHSRPYPRFELLLSIFSEWLKHRRELSEMRRLDRTEFDRIASDLRVSPSDLEELVRQGPHAADELPKLLKALGIEDSDLASVHPLVLRDMERVCAICQQKGPCDRDLEAGTSAEHYQGYCPNAAAIEQLDQTATN
jgi:hypothetical protein